MSRVQKRRSFHTEVDSEGSWAISYGDMVTLLLTFFIIFFTAEKFELDKNMRADVFGKQEHLKAKLAESVEVAKMPDERVKDEVRGRVFQLGQRVIVEFSGVSFFPSGSTDLTGPATTALDKFFSAYSPYMGQYDLSIRAFTDPRKVMMKKNRGFKDNLELSALRSVSVMRHLQKSGIPLANMKLSGYGEMYLSKADVEMLPEAERRPTSINDLARTVVLVIEPREDL